MTRMRPRPRSVCGTAAIASLAFLMMLVSACEISRRSKRAGIGSCSRSRSMSMSALPTRMQEHRLARGVGNILGGDHRLRHAGELGELVHHALDVVDLAHDRVGALIEHRRVVGDRLAVFAAQPLGRELDRGQRVLDLMGDAAGDVGPGRGALRRHQLGDVVERDDIAAFGLRPIARW